MGYAGLPGRPGKLQQPLSGLSAMQAAGSGTPPCDARSYVTIMQTRSGSWFQVVRVNAAEVVKPAEIIEGTLARSKGFFTVGGRLLRRDDLAWALSPTGGQEGVRVRVYGQSRTVVCGPEEQCLIEGSLPLFDVGRAVRLP